MEKKMLQRQKEYIRELFSMTAEQKHLQCIKIWKNLNITIRAKFGTSQNEKKQGNRTTWVVIAILSI